MSNFNYIKKLKNKVRERKFDILEICHKYGGHIATSFSSTEILCYLYYYFFNLKKNNILIISKGHCSELIYSILSDLKFFPKKWFEKHFSRNKFILGQHIDKNIPGIEFSSGALGHGLPFACGKALSLKKNKENKKIFVLMGDAEFCEGSNWEALLFAKKFNLDNLFILLDYNKIGSLDYLNNTSSLAPFDKKFKSFGLDVYFAKNGNDINNIDRIFKNFKNSKNPKVIILNTVKGYGAKIFENDPIWHVKKISKEDYLIAKEQLLKKL